MGALTLPLTENPQYQSATTGSDTMNSSLQSSVKNYTAPVVTEALQSRQQSLSGMHKNTDNSNFAQNIRSVVLQEPESYKDWNLSEWADYFSGKGASSSWDDKTWDLFRYASSKSENKTIPRWNVLNPNINKMFTMERIALPDEIQKLMEQHQFDLSPGWGMFAMTPERAVKEYNDNIPKLQQYDWNGNPIGTLPEPIVFPSESGIRVTGANPQYAAKVPWMSAYL